MMACPLQRGTPVDPLGTITAAETATGHWEIPFAREPSAYTVVPARAILDGTPADLVIRPGDRQFDVVLGVAAPSASAPEENQLFSPDVAGNDWRRAPKPTRAR